MAELGMVSFGETRVSCEMIAELEKDLLVLVRIVSQLK